MASDPSPASQLDALERVAFELRADAVRRAGAGDVEVLPRLVALHDRVLKLGVARLLSRFPDGARAGIAGRVADGLDRSAETIIGSLPGGRRDRLFVHAEPGLTATLLYAAAKILPPQFTADLTFSTFEPAHRSIRDYRLATVVGTYLGSPDKGLDPDLTTSDGYGFDALETARSSPELSVWMAVPEGILALSSEP